MKTLYVSDLDGTLLTPSTDISPFTVKTVNSLIEKGMIFTFATARSMHSARNLLKDLSLEQPVILYNGVAIKSPCTGKIIAKNFFSQSERESILSVMEKHCYNPLVYSFRGDREQVSWLEGQETDWIFAYINSRKNDDRMNPCTSKAQLTAGDVYYFTCIDEKENLLPIFNEIKDLDCCNAIFQKEIYNESYWLEIMPKSANKGNAVNELKKMLGCEKVVAFGDSVNDIPMFSVADECYATENAVEELKKIATGIVQSNSQNGVAKWLLENFQEST